MIEQLMQVIDGLMYRQSAYTILDVGSRDALVAIEFAEHFPNAKIYAFECNPPAISICRRNVANHPNIVLVENAVSDVCGPVGFYAIDPEKTVTAWPDGNIGASSLFIANPAYPVETYYQNRITVEAITLKQWAQGVGINTIDILWMDLQGAELKALMGMGDLLDTVSFIYTEVEYKEMYIGQPLFDTIDRYLTKHGFYLHSKLNTSQWFGDAIYVRT